MHIFSPGAYSVINKGDAALVDAHIAWLREGLGADSVTLASFTPEPDALYYGEPVIPMLVSPMRLVHRIMERATRGHPALRQALTTFRLRYVVQAIRILRVWAAINRVNPRVARILAPSRLRSTSEAIARSDACIAVPGGYLNALTPTDDWWAYHVPTLALIKAMGRPLILAPCSIGPFHDDHKSLAEFLLPLCDLILVREDVSHQHALDLGVDADKILSAPDLGFRFTRSADPVAVSVTQQEQVERRRTARILGVSVRRHVFPASREPEFEQQKYIGLVAEAISALVETDDCEVVIVPQTLEDLSVGQDLSAALSQLGVDHETRQGDYTPIELCRMYASMRLLIGTRMHANILAMSVGTPVAAIGYEPKTLGILSRMSLEDWGLEIEELDNDRLKDLVLRQWRNADQCAVDAKSAAAEQAQALDAVTHRVVLFLRGTSTPANRTERAQ